MAQLGNQHWLHAAMLVLWGVGAMNSTIAAPPSGSARAALDLRPSTSTIAAVEKTNAPFPSAARSLMEEERHFDLPALGSEGGQTRIPSRAEEFARRIHREGLPIARLWENKSALLSLGLNKKGKAGLWIVQKTR